MYSNNFVCIEPKLCQTNDFSTLYEKSATIPPKGINLNFLEQFKNYGNDVLHQNVDRKYMCNKTFINFCTLKLF